MKRIYACILIVAALLGVSLYSSGRVQGFAQDISADLDCALRLYGRKIFPLHGRRLPRVQSCATPCGRL